ncbi:MAG: pyridoxal-phosphate dependent enzyme [Anaerolineaceae bacterium]|nr:pyridoxal-phosphate dependent enzyme [Anaerolineaceae bacterium]
MAELICSQCGQAYPSSGLPFRCSKCGGVYEFDGLPILDLDRIEPDLPGIWKYRHTFDLFPNAPVVSLAEGNTPLLWDEVNGARIGFKMEGANPSGSYKDRAVAVMVSQLLARGATSAVEDSSGNAGSSFAAYAARTGLKAKVFVPEHLSGAKGQQIQMYGAELMRVPGPRSAAATAVMNEAKQGAVYASHAYLPFGMRGIATMAYEIWEQMGYKTPGSIICPIGHAHSLMGIIHGFAALKNAGLVDTEPYYVGVQAKACAPIWEGFYHGVAAMEDVEEGQTEAEGVRVLRPKQGANLIAYLSGGDRGTIHAIEEERVMEGFHQLAERGIYVEPSSALAWIALNDMIGKLPEPAVLIMTGMGLKHTIES